MITDEHSGAVLFVRTPEERKSDEMEERVGLLENLIMQMAEGKVDPKEVKAQLTKKE